MKKLIGVIGSGDASSEQSRIAEEVGRNIANIGCILVCGGLGGVMEAAAKGAKSADGLTVGIIPGPDRGQANPYIDIPVVTGLGEARNLIVVKSSNSIIAIGGSFGTLSEISFALKHDIPLIGLNTWDVSDKIIKCNNPKQAVNTAYELANPTVS